MGRFAVNTIIARFKTTGTPPPYCSSRKMRLRSAIQGSKQPRRCFFRCFLKSPQRLKNIRVSRPPRDFLKYASCKAQEALINQAFFSERDAGFEGKRAVMRTKCQIEKEGCHAIHSPGDTCAYAASAAIRCRRISRARTFHIGQSAYLAGTSPQAGGSAYDRGQLERQAVLRPIAVHKRETRPYAEYPVA